MLKRLALAAALAVFLCPMNALAQGKAFSTVTTAAPTAATFSQVLARSDNRLGCTITNIGTTQGYCQMIPPGFTPTTANSIPVAPNGGQFYCSAAPGSTPISQDQVQCTCASGTCAFVVNSMGQ